jgi:calmodulin
MVESLSDEKIAEFKCAFELFDKDNDGVITCKELGVVLNTLGQELSNEDLNDLIKDVDTNDNGRIDFEEFLNLMVRKMKDTDTEEEMQEAFRVFDREGSGYITKKSMKDVMVQLGENLSFEDLEDIMRDYDGDHDGQLNYDDFKKMMTFQ